MQPHEPAKNVAALKSPRPPPPSTAPGPNRALATPSRVARGGAFLPQKRSMKSYWWSVVSSPEINVAEWEVSETAVEAEGVGSLAARLLRVTSSAALLQSDSCFVQA